jgi:hypothetical protein
VVAADGANSATRAGSRRATFGPELERRRLPVHLARAPTWSSTRSSSTSWQTRPGSCRCTAIRTATRPAPSSWRCTRTSGGGPGSGPMPRPALAPGQSDERSIELIRGLCADVLGGTSWSPTTPGGLSFTTVRCRPGGTATWCCSATPRTPRTSRSARAPSWPWRTRWRWPPACTRTGRASARRWPPTRPSAARWSPRPSGPRRPAWSGSRTSASTPARTRTSSPSTS